MQNLVFLFYICVKVCLATSKRGSVFEASVIRDGKIDSFKLLPCRSKDSANELERRTYCQTNLGGVLLDCLCLCPKGTVAFPLSPRAICRPLEELRSPYADLGQLSQYRGLRSFSPLSTIELKIPNCAAEDPSLLHLDRATTFGWRDYVNVVIKVFSLINQRSGLPMSIVRLWTKSRSLPEGQLFRLQFTAPCVYSSTRQEKYLRGDFIYFVTTGKAPLPSPRRKEFLSRRPRDFDRGDANNEDDRDYFDFYGEKYGLEYGRDDGDIRKAGLAVPFIGVIVIAVVIAIILFVVSVKLMKSYCCFCRKEDEDANEPRLNPFQDYAPSKREAAAPREFPLQRDRAMAMRRNVSAAHLTVNLNPSNCLEKDRVMNPYERTPGVCHSWDVSGSHTYESLDGYRRTGQDEKKNEKPPAYDESVAEGGGGEPSLDYLENVVLPNKGLQVPTTRSRNGYMSWSGVNQSRELESNQNATATLSNLAPIPHRLSFNRSTPERGLSTEFPASMPKDMPPSPPRQSRRSKRKSSTIAKGLSPHPICQLPPINGSTGVAPAIAESGAVAAAAPDSGSGSAKDGDVMAPPPLRRQSIHKMPASIIPKFKIEYDKRYSQDGANSSNPFNRLRHSLRNEEKSSFVYYSQSPSGTRLSSSSSNDNVFFGEYTDARASSVSTGDRIGSSIITHDGSANLGTRI